MRGQLLRRLSITHHIVTVALEFAIGGLLLISFCQTVSASSFGQGYFGVIAFGAQTNISMSLGGNVNLSLVPSGSTFSASGSGTVTVTTNDVNGYDLYIYNPGSASLTNGSASIPASANTSEAALANDTWGYNTDGSTNYIGLTTSPALILATTGPYESGNTTTLTYGVLTSIVTPEGTYSGHVTFTAVALTD